MNNSINSKIEILKSEFEILDNPMDKYQHIIDIGKNKEDISQNIRQEENLIKGCVSKAWMHIKSKNEPIKIITDSDAVIVRGLLSILKYIIDGITLEELGQLKIEFILKEIGLEDSITSQRTNGFMSALNKIKEQIN